MDRSGLQCNGRLRIESIKAKGRMLSFAVVFDGGAMVGTVWRLSRSARFVNAWLQGLRFRARGANMASAVPLTQARGAAMHPLAWARGGNHGATQRRWT
jgi:hypothetical protein